MDDQKAPRDLLNWLGTRALPDWGMARLLGRGVAVVVALLIAGACAAIFALVYGVLLGGGAAGCRDLSQRSCFPRCCHEGGEL